MEELQVVSVDFDKPIASPSESISKAYEGVVYKPIPVYVIYFHIDPIKRACVQEAYDLLQRLKSVYIVQLHECRIVDEDFRITYERIPYTLKGILGAGGDVNVEDLLHALKCAARGVSDMLLHEPKLSKYLSGLNTEDILVTDEKEVKIFFSPRLFLEGNNRVNSSVMSSPISAFGGIIEAVVDRILDRIGVNGCASRLLALRQECNSGLISFTDVIGRLDQLSSLEDSSVTLEGKLLLSVGGMSRPAGIWASGGDLVYIAESGAGRVCVWSRKTGNIIKRFGTEGTGDGELNRPSAICESGGLIYVSDTYNGRISVFTCEGEWVRHLGEGVLIMPGGVCVANDLVFVTCCHSLHVFTTAGDAIRTWNCEGTYAGHLFVTDQEVYVVRDVLGGIIVFDFDGNIIRQWEAGEAGKYARGLCHRRGVLMVADYCKHQVRIVSPWNGKVLDIIETDLGAGPWGIDADDHYVYVTLTDQNRLQIYR